MSSIDPATGDVLATFEPYSAAEVDRRVARAQDAWRAWRTTSFATRAEIMIRTAGLLERESAELGRLMSREMGKPIRAATEEAAKCATGCRYYAAHAATHLARRDIPTESGQSFVLFHPIGVVLAVMPWNFPFWQVFRFAAPALMAGNVVLLKHASNVPQCALAIEDILRRAGFPEGAFQTLLIPPDQVQRVLDDPRVAGASLTGSEQAGRNVAGAAGRQIKKTVLELGGSDPFIVMSSADMRAAIETAVKARIVNKIGRAACRERGEGWVGGGA